MIKCDEFTAEIVGDDTNPPELEVRVVKRNSSQPPRIYRYPASDVHEAYRNERGFLDFKEFCSEVVFHDAGCDTWPEPEHQDHRRVF